MDEIVEKFGTTLKAEKGDESFKTLYKNWGKFNNQEQRRLEILNQQKSDRRQKLDNCRGILTLIQSAQERDGIFSRTYEYRPNVYVPGFTRRSYYLDNILMHSEWLIEKPDDLSTNWYMTPCPVGVRMLVIAGNGVTKCYTKYGQFRFEVQTLLPGGNYQERKKNCSVLDCFYFSDMNTMYVLDILSWNSHIMADGEMEFRYFWLQTKFKENPGLDKVTKRNKLSFQLLPMIPCDKESIQKFMSTYPPITNAKLDGLLFYHKKAHYVPGVTPLVGWLFPFMVPEIFGQDVTIHEAYAAGKPADYVDQATFIQQFEEKMSKKKTFPRRKQRRGSSNSQGSNADSSMDSEECPNQASGEVPAIVEAQTDTNSKDGTVSMDAETTTEAEQNKATQKKVGKKKSKKTENKMDSEESTNLPHITEGEGEATKTTESTVNSHSNNDTKDETSMEAETQTELTGAFQVTSLSANYDKSIFRSPYDIQEPITSFYRLFD